ncbi:MAG: relaxase domain-containing protein [Rhodospirillales bacterium]|nr:relaxase domain-containing protein [Rhodospirillales bacterium]MDE0380269.1 relaxase domain-containing protein [Rhodospirillales bacterium]
MRYSLCGSQPEGVGYFEKGGCYAKDDGAHDKAVSATLGWIKANAILETRTRDPATGAMVRAGDQKMIAAIFRHDTSRNLDPQLHAHAVVANMVQGCRPESAAQTMTLVRSAG